jgi:endonuclease YncB( thermonuclease family)
VRLRRYRGLLATATLAALALAAVGWVNRAEPSTVESITDGDTFRVVGMEMAVRIANIEAPDSQSYADNGRASPECVDAAAAQTAEDNLAALIPVGTVVEIHDTGERSWDRMIAYVSVNDQDVGDLMLATGTVDSWPHDGGPCPWN